jgi:murein DD-endopeptidase MepM/ murein hydrolase activator NlpD
MRRLGAAAAIALAFAAGTARADDGRVLGFTANASAGAPVAQVSLPSASAPNAPGSISVPVDLTSPPAVPQRLPVAALAELWHRAGAAYGIPWQVLAAIDKIESNFGQNMGPSSAGAVGWMQFMPDTWLRWGVDADGNGVADPWNAADAIFAAARYLAASGGQSDIARAVFSYNHADWYVNEVLQLANVYGQGGTAETVDLEKLQAALRVARLQVVAANRRVNAALGRERAIVRAAAKLRARAEQIPVLSDRLAAERRAALYGARVVVARAARRREQSALANAQAGLRSAQKQAEAPSFAPGAASLLAAPSYGNGYVFPVGGGPSLVSAAHTHHDYPAVDIAAPEGSPVYALADSVVENAWQAPDPRCGIGMTIRADDGQVWTYCHLSYLAPAVVTGGTVSAGEQVGLVGHTGDATGPHLHLQLQPPTQWPQQETWFESFAGRAFRWQDAPTPRALAAARQAPVFAVVSDDSEPTISFTR